MQLQNAALASDEDAIDEIAEGLLSSKSLTRSKEYCTFAKLLRRNGRWEAAVALLDISVQKGERRGFEIFGQQVSNFAPQGKWEHCIQLLDEAVSELPWGAPATLRNKVLYALHKAGAWEQGLVLLEETVEIRKQDIDTLNLGLSICAHGKLWEKALAMMEEMRSVEATPRWKMFERAIMLAGIGNHWKAALDMLDDMWASGVPPTAITYSAVIDACRKNGQLELAAQMLREMRRKGFQPGPLTVKTVLETVEAAGLADLAEQLKSEFRAVLK